MQNRREEIIKRSISCIIESVKMDIIKCSISCIVNRFRLFEHCRTCNEINMSYATHTESGLLLSPKCSQLLAFLKADWCLIVLILLVLHVIRHT